MALAVRAAQCNQQKALTALLGITIACAFCFLGIKYIEYKSKWDHHLVPGQARIVYFFSGQYFEDAVAEEDQGPPAGGVDSEESLHYIAEVLTRGGHGSGHGAATTVHENEEDGNQTEEDGEHDEDVGEHAEEGGHNAAQGMSKAELKRRFGNIQSFLGIYFVMTGLHGLHVVIGIGVLTWILIRARKGHFSSEYFEPVDLVGLYWHLVDLIWIYLFPLLYLIH
jgi:cytochrome c oxidase subunit 3